MMLNFSKTVFLLLLITNSVLTIFFQPYETDFQQDQPSQKNISKFESAVRTVESLVVLILVIIGIILIIFRYQNLAWIYYVISVPMCSGFVALAYISIGITKKVIQSEQPDKLSAKEHSAIGILAYALLILCLINAPTKLMDAAANLENVIISDCLHGLFYILFLFLYLFFICALLPVPLTYLSKFTKKLNALILNKTNLHQIGDYFINKIDNSSNKQPLLFKVVNASTSKCPLLRIVAWSISPLLLTLDVFLFIVTMLWSLLLTSIGYAFWFFRMINCTIGKAASRLDQLSDRRLVSISFRVALIIALSITVITNRYVPIFKAYESSTAVLEFVASAILIPVVFEWINSIKDKHSTKDSILK